MDKLTYIGKIINEVYQRTKNWAEADRVEECLSTLYDDFEARTCLECSYSSKYSAQEVWCTLHAEEYFKDFGCNKWQSKD